MPTLDDYLDEIRKAREDANSANEKRYTDILEILKRSREGTGGRLDEADQILRDRVSQVEELLRSSGRGAKREATRRSAERSAASDQSLMDRGLFNSTVLDANRRREGETLGREVDDIEERVSGQRAGALSQLLGDLAGFQSDRAGFERGETLDETGVMERRSDLGPDMGAFLNLLNQLGQSQGGTGGRTFNFAGINKPGGPIDPFGNRPSGSGSSGGSAGSGSSSGSGVGFIAGQGNTNEQQDPFANQKFATNESGALERSAGPANKPYWVAHHMYGSGWAANPPPPGPNVQKVSQFHYIVNKP